MAGSRSHEETCAARWNRASTSLAVPRRESGLHTSPLVLSTDAGSETGSRGNTSARTVHPALRRIRTRARPTKPVDPVTRASGATGASKMPDLTIVSGGRLYGGTELGGGKAARGWESAQDGPQVLPPLEHDGSLRNSPGRAREGPGYQPDRHSELRGPAKVAC